jgi:hypothetical protein
MHRDGDDDRVEVAVIAVKSLELAKWATIN